MSKELETLQVELEEARGAIEALSNKNKELLNEKRKLKATYESVDVEQYHKTLDEVESLRATNEKLQKQYKTDLEKLSNDLNQKDTYLQKKIVDDGLRQSLVEAGVPKEFITPAMAMLKSEIKLANDNGEYKALVGETALNEFVPKWYNEGDGKVFNIAKPDTNAGTNGKPNTGGEIDAKKFFDRNSEHFNLTKQAEIMKSNPDLYNQLKQG